MNTYLTRKELDYLEINPHQKGDFVVNKVLVEWLRFSNKRKEYPAFVFKYTKDHDEHMISILD